MLETHVNTAGDLFVFPSFRNNYLQVCNINASWKGVSQGTCQAWYAAILSGVTTGQTMTFHYAGDASTCSALPTYQDAPAAVYVMLKRTQG